MKYLTFIPFLFLLPSFSFAQPVTQEPDDSDYQAMSEALANPNTGLVLEVHGADHQHGTIVFTWRDKQDFFKYAELPISGRNPGAQATIDGIGRGDLVRVWGAFDLFLPPSQRHIDVEKIVVENSQSSACKDANLPPYQYQVKGPDDLKDLTEATVQVHGVENGGNKFVVDYLDTVIPVIAPEPARVADLYKGDIVKRKFTVSANPKAPVHFRLKSGADAVEVVQSILNVNPKSDQDTKTKRCGSLVFFKKSRVINSNVFAIDTPATEGYDWYFTLFNTDRKVFSQIRDKLQTVWDAHMSTAQCGRNYLVNPNIVVCATGPGNVSDPAQANPQIMVQSPDDVTVDIISR